MNRNVGLAVVAVLVALMVVVAAVAAAGFGLFGLLLYSFDHATYQSNATNFEDLDYDRVVANADSAGYDVETYWVNARPAGDPGVHPAIPELDAKYGDEYRVWMVEMPYEYGENATASWDDASMSIDYELSGSRVTFTDFEKGIDDPFTVADLPEDEWIVTRLTVLFEMDEATAQRYVDDLKDSIGDGTTRLVQFTVSERPAYERGYAALNEWATDVSVSDTRGEGLFRETYADADGRIADVTYAVPNSEIAHRVGSATYVVKVDQLGGTYLRITLPPGEEIPESEYRETFASMFVDLGLDPAEVGEFEFEYTSSNW